METSKPVPVRVKLLEVGSLSGYIWVCLYKDNLPAKTNPHMESRQKTAEKPIRFKQPQRHHKGQISRCVSRGDSFYLQDGAKCLLFKLGNI